MTPGTAAFRHKPSRNVLRLPPDTSPILTVVIDCEEGFDWLRPLRGTPHDLLSIGQLHRVAQRLRRHNARLTCVTAHAVLADDDAWRDMNALVSGGDAVLGVHLHPWVTAPFGEEATIANSYQGNLPPELEAAKIATVAELYESRTGRRPTLFKAGRSGFGANTARTLADQGFEIDLSFMPLWDYRNHGGPSFADVGCDPFFFDLPGTGSLLEIPDTSGYVGLARGLGARLFPRANRELARRVKLPGILVRTGLLNRIPLTPEGVTQAEARQLSQVLFAEGQRIFQLSFHSTSLIPGQTAYTKTEAEVEALLQWLDDYIGFFRHTLGGTVVTPEDVRAALSAA